MKWFGSAMAARRSWKPLLVAALVIVMLALAWLPTGELDPDQRSNKPFLYATYTIDAAANSNEKGHLEDIAFDIQQRIEQRHEWRISETPEPRAWQLTVQVTSHGMLVLNGELTAPASKTTEGSVQRFKVQGPADSYAALPEQYVKILIQLVENGHKA